MSHRTIGLLRIAWLALAAGLLAVAAAVAAPGPLPGIDTDRLDFRGGQIVADGVDPCRQRGSLTGLRSGAACDPAADLAAHSARVRARLHRKEMGAWSAWR
jgi:hypothetical protein